MKTWLVLTLAAAVTAGGLSTLNARLADGPDGGRPHPGQFRERVKKQLDLTDDQVAQMKEQLKGERETMQSLAARLQKARLALQEAIGKPDATETSVREAAAKLAVVQSDMAVQRLKMRGLMSSILTEEQRAKLKDLRADADRPAKRGARRGQQRARE